MTEEQVKIMEIETKLIELETELMKAKDTENRALKRLEELNRTSKAELENSLLKESLIISNSRYETLKSEQDKTINGIISVLKDLKNKIGQIETSNNMLSNAIESEIGVLSGKVEKVVAELDQEVKNGLEAKIERLNGILESANKRNSDYFKRKYWIDRYIGIFVATPLLYVFYLILKAIFETFFK